MVLLLFAFPEQILKSTDTAHQHAPSPAFGAGVSLFRGHLIQNKTVLDLAAIRRSIGQEKLSLLNLCLPTITRTEAKGFRPVTNSPGARANPGLFVVYFRETGQFLLA